MAKQFVMTMRVPLPDDLFEQADILSVLKKTMTAFDPFLEQNMPAVAHMVTINVFTPRVPRKPRAALAAAAASADHRAVKAA